MSEFPASVVQYLEKHVRKSKTEGGCWDWTGQSRKDRDGFPHPEIPEGPRSKKSLRGTRVAYEFWNGPIPEGKRIARSCGDTLCLNPAHLLALSYQEERKLRKAWKGTETEVQVDIRADGTAYVYTLTKHWEGHIRKMRGAEDQGNGEFILGRGQVRFIGLRSHETKHSYVKRARAEYGDAGDGFYARGVQERGWEGWKEEEAQHLGVADEWDVG